MVTIITGIDIQSFDEVEESIARFGGRYLRRIYSEREVAECMAHLPTMARCLAVRFAAKEAVLKALTPHDHIPSWRTIEVLFHSKSSPTVELCGEAELLARRRGVEKMFLSVSLGRGCAVAAVVADVTSSGVASDSRAEPR